MTYPGILNLWKIECNYRLTLRFVTLKTYQTAWQFSIYSTSVVTEWTGKTCLNRNLNNNWVYSNRNLVLRARGNPKFKGPEKLQQGDLGVWKYQPGEMGWEWGPSCGVSLLRLGLWQIRWRSIQKILQIWILDFKGSLGLWVKWWWMRIC